MSSAWRRLALLLVAGTLALAGCADGDKDGDKDAGRAAVPVAQQATAKLAVTLEQISRTTEIGARVLSAPSMSCAQGDPTTCTRTITCPSEGLDSTLCGWLATEDWRAASRPPLVNAGACAPPSDGPETATVAGTIEKGPITLRFTRSDQCEIDRFDAASPLWGGPLSYSPGASDTDSAGASL